MYLMITMMYLGKTRPKTGVVFQNQEEAAQTTQSKSGGVLYELIAPDNSPVFLSFSAPWVSRLYELRLLNNCIPTIKSI